MLHNFLADLIETAFEPEMLKDALIENILIDYDTIANEILDERSDEIQELASEYARTVL